jgi:hypothetical protein
MDWMVDWPINKRYNYDIYLEIWDEENQKGGVFKAEWVYITKNEYLSWWEKFDSYKCFAI